MEKPILVVPKTITPDELREQVEKHPDAIVVAADEKTLSENSELKTALSENNEPNTALVSAGRQVGRRSMVSAMSLLAMAGAMGLDSPAADLFMPPMKRAGVNKYTPHQGPKAKERRLRQMARDKARQEAREAKKNGDKK